MRNQITFSIILSIFIISFACQGTAYAQASKVVGEAFGKPVTEEEFNYFLKTASIFTRAGRADSARSEEEVRSEAWQSLVFSKEAKAIGIDISRQELETEIKRLLSEKDIDMKSPNYPLWIAAAFGEDISVFEKRIKDLMIVSKFIELKSNPDVTVTEEEMELKFKNQHSSFESEYIMFDTRQECEDFRERVVKTPKLWKETYDAKKPDGQQGASWINSMSLEALIDLWKIPTEDAYNILSRKLGDFIVADFFYGTAVFRLLNKKVYDMDKYTDNKKEEYRNTLTRSKRHRISKEYFDDLSGRAAIRDYVMEEKAAQTLKELKQKNIIALETSSGIIRISLFPEIAPLACENFVGLVEKGYYDGVIFHRVIKDFMIQAGDPTGTGAGGDSIWGAPFINETSEEILFDRPGLLAMANAGADTNKSQFFITTKPAPHLNYRHTIFGEVLAGFDIVQKIENAETDSSNRPKKEQRIIRAYVDKQD